VAFVNYDAYLNALKANISAEWQLSQAFGQGTRFNNAPQYFTPAPGTPGASTALSKSNARAINQLVPDAGSGRMSILGGSLRAINNNSCAIMLVDILNVSGGLNATLTTEQTTNLPTAALTRYTDGVGVHAALAIYSLIGSVGTTATVKYTNQDNTSGRVSTAFSIGATGARDEAQLLRIPLQAGDTGVRSVASVTLAATTTAAGNFGVVLYKPLAMFFVNDVENINVIDCVSSGRMVGQLNEVLDNACLSFFSVAAASSTWVAGNIFLGEA
jgi:hypothetical protein